MPCGRFKRVRQAQVVSPEFNAFKWKLRLTILMTLVSEKRHGHPEHVAAEHTVHQLAAGALGMGGAETDPLLSQLRIAQAESTSIRRTER